jgi:hypothetical protein
LNTDFLVTQMLKSEQDIEGKCIFYTGVSEEDKVQQLWGRGENLSRTAAEYACRLGMYSIWVRKGFIQRCNRAFMDHSLANVCQPFGRRSSLAETRTWSPVSNRLTM